MKILLCQSYNKVRYKHDEVMSVVEEKVEHDAGWSSPEARRAHNPKAAGSNPAPATRIKNSPTQ